MRDQILGFKEQFKPFDFSLKRYSSIIICGMGGSGLPGRILKDLAPIPIHNVHSYSLPFFSKDALVVCISYSGNTKETLSCYSEAKRRGMALAAITSGGKLLSRCMKDDVANVVVPSGMEPRMALGYMFTALACILRKSLDPSLFSALKRMKLDDRESEGRKLARTISDKMPVIYSSLPSLSYFWKISLNESGKTSSFSNEFPELCHNELEALEDKKRDIIFLFLKDEKSLSRKQEKIVIDLYKKKGRDVVPLNLKGGNRVEKVFASVLLAYWTSYHLALMKGIDPGPVGMIEELKKRI